MKKILSSMAVLALALGFASADVKFSFYNKLYEEDAFVDHYDNGRDDDGNSESVTDFMGIKNRMYFEVFTDRVDAMIKADVRFDDNDNDHYGLDGRLKDWYLEFRPIEIATLSLHTGIFSDGSYLPVYDDNINAGNIGSDGLTFTLRPVEGLRFGVTAPFSMDSDWGDKNYFNGDKDEDESDKFDFGIGAIYGQELFQIGFSVQDVADSDERQIGAYINLPTLFGVSEAVTVGAGFAHSEKYRTIVADADTISLGDIGADVSYKNLLSAYATLDFEKFGIAAEIAYNMSDDEPDVIIDDDPFDSYDLYSAASISFGLADKLTASVTGKILSDLKSKNDTNKTILFGAFGLEYEANEKNTLGCEFNIATCDKDWSIAIPVFWKYHFEN